MRSLLTFALEKRILYGVRANGKRLPYAATHLV
jgi:hypothetical protein